MIDNSQNLLTCKCGSLIFTQEVSSTFDNGSFIIHAGNGARIVPFDNTIPYAKCICCGRISIPRSSFNGRNRLDRIVQVYEELLIYSEKINANIDEIENRVYHIHGDEELKAVEDVKTEPTSGADPEVAVQGRSKRGPARKSDK